MTVQKILVVDDNKTIVEMLISRLSALGHVVLPAYNGLDALELARTSNPDLILLDIMMPYLDGLEVAKILKANVETRSIPIIFLTVKDRLQDKVIGLKAGADDYITKPFHWEELEARVQAALRRARPPEPEDAPAPQIRGISGGLADVSLSNLIQLIEVDRKSGVLTLTRKDQSGYLMFNQGTIANAVVGDLKGEAAVYRLLTWEEGGFLFEPWHSSVESQIGASNQELIMEGMRRLDEWRNLKAKLPSLNSIFKRSPEGEKALKEGTLTQGQMALLNLCDGVKDIRTVLGEAPGDDLKAMEDLVWLYNQGMLEVARLGY